jgi:hypothetical protein
MANPMAPQAPAAPTMGAWDPLGSTATPVRHAFYRNY